MQLYEQHINFMSDHVIKLFKEYDKQPDKDPLTKKAKLFFKYMDYLNKEQSDFLHEKYEAMSHEEREEFFQEMEANGIFIHQQPFFGNPDFDVFKKIYKEMPELCTPYKFEGIENPMVMGDLYFIRLIISLHLLNCWKLFRA